MIDEAGELAPRRCVKQCNLDMCLNATDDLASSAGMNGQSFAKQALPILVNLAPVGLTAPLLGTVV